jgi:biopolymer transport protein ExbD
MAGASSRAPGGAITGINVTPLVDITLVLLIIFMVTAKLVVSHVAVPVDLPKATTGNDVQEIFSVTLGVDGVSHVDGKALGGDDDILPLARAARSANKDLRAVIKADGSVPHRRVMHVLDLLRQAGVAKVGFGIDPVAPSTAVAG